MHQYDRGGDPLCARSLYPRHTLNSARRARAVPCAFALSLSLFASCACACDLSVYLRTLSRADPAIAGSPADASADYLGTCDAAKYAAFADAALGAYEHHISLDSMCGANPWAGDPGVECTQGALLWNLLDDGTRAQAWRRAHALGRSLPTRPS